MLELNKLHKLKKIVVSLCILFSISTFSQNKKNSEKSTIVMTQSELDSFLSTIAEARRTQIKERDSRKMKQDLTELRSKSQQSSLVQPLRYENVSNEQILRELNYLNQRIDHLSSSSNSISPLSRDNSTIIMPSSTQASNPALYPNARTITTLTPAKDYKIKQLEFTIDSLKNAYKSKKSYNSLNDSLAGVKERLRIVRRQMDSLEMKAESSQKSFKKDVLTGKTYFRQQVYFDNNSETLRDEYLKYIQNLTNILVKYPEAKVLLEGWASPLGKTIYNKQLSMRRAESVEKIFLKNGIEIKRILTSFRGEDLSSSASHARRVEMSIIVQ
ncbi:OmpA family protein [Flavobacterium sp. PL12]|uniref:OmpA family protein n=1 Tax=Flavobacterium sp. PL12 TaxID=3071718 RepID=UPI00319DAF4C